MAPVTVGERIAVVETALELHIRRCEERATRMEKWLRGGVMGVGLLCVEAVLKLVSLI